MRKGSPLREVVIAALPADNQTGFGRWPNSFNVGQIQQNSLESLIITTGAGARVLASGTDVVVGSSFEFDVLGYHYQVGLSAIGSGPLGRLVLFDGVRWSNDGLLLAE